MVTVAEELHSFVIAHEYANILRYVGLCDHKYYCKLCAENNCELFVTDGNANKIMT